MHTTQPGKRRMLKVFKLATVLDVALPSSVKCALLSQCATPCRQLNEAFVWPLKTACQTELGFVLVVFCCQLWGLVKTLGQINSWQNFNLLYNEVIIPPPQPITISSCDTCLKIPVLITYNQNQSCGSLLGLSGNHGPLEYSGLYQGWGQKASQLWMFLQQRHKMGKRMKQKHLMNLELSGRPCREPPWSRGASRGVLNDYSAPDSNMPCCSPEYPVPWTQQTESSCLADQ